MPKIVDHDAQRTRIARAAVAAFRQDGYSGVSLRRIAEAAGASKSAMYHYFPDKRALFEAASREVLKMDGQAQDYNDLAAWARSLEPVFGAELRLIMDFLKECGQDAGARSILRQSIEQMRETAHRLRPDAQSADEALALVVGWLCVRLMDPQFDPDGRVLTSDPAPRA
ncbi:MAG: TetR family transcriptional regulator [Alphaproteobacteria bacterium]|nr:TetR family transcriptional regulator [Alphaproteobacteria bacterium]